jgi:hypothetical protein
VIGKFAVGRVFHIDGDRRSAGVRLVAENHLDRFATDGLAQNRGAAAVMLGL